MHRTINSRNQDHRKKCQIVKKELITAEMVKILLNHWIFRIKLFLRQHNVFAHINKKSVPYCNDKHL